MKSEDLSCKNAATMKTNTLLIVLVKTPTFVFAISDCYIGICYDDPIYYLLVGSYKSHTTSDKAEDLSKITLVVELDIKHQL